MTEMPWYRDWFNSPFYHKLYFERDEKEAGNFIKNIVEYLKPPKDSRMLDVACGRGRHSRMLADYGYSVTGIDLSPDSIEFAKSRKIENAEFYVHDMRLPFIVNYFDYAFNFFTSFGFFKTRREHENAIRTIANGLKNGGIFLIDYLNVHFAEDHLILNEIREIGYTKYEILRWQNKTHFYKKIITYDDSLPAPIEFTEKISMFSLDDFTEMLSLHNMQVKEVFGDYNLGSYDLKKSPRMILKAIKLKN